jgi:hypothetical protein
MPVPRSLLWALLLALPACARQLSNLCPNLEVASPVAEENQTHYLEPRAGLTGLVPTVDSGKFVPPAEVRDCRDQRVESPANNCDGTAAAAARDATHVLSPDDLVITDREGDEFLVWAQAHHFTDGDALGPVAIAHWFKRGIRVSALGPLRGPARHARLRLEPLSDGRVLMVEGDACPPGGAACTRVVRLLPLVDGTFTDEPMRLLDAEGCAGPATFPLSATHDVRLAPAKIRRFRIQRNVLLKDGFGTVHEEAVATDLVIDPARPTESTAEGVEFRRYSKARELRLDEHGLVIQAGIWDQLLAEDGSIRPSDHAEPPTGARRP